MSDLVPAVRAVASVDGPRRFLDLVHEMWRVDPEHGHSVNDMIRARVLELCAQGHPEAAVLAPLGPGDRPPGDDAISWVA